MVSLPKQDHSMRAVVLTASLGKGPMFEEDEVRNVIEDVGRSGGDELI